MGIIIEFIIEKTIINSIPILLGVVVFAMFFGKVLDSIGISKRLKSIIYAIVGAISGLWAYSSYDIPERSIELLEALLLGSGFFIITMSFIELITWFKTRKRGPSTP